MTNSKHRTIRWVGVAAAVAAVSLPLLAPTPAHAWWRGGWGPGFYVGFPVPYVVAPPVVYGPPPVAYAPPQMAYAPRPAWIPGHWQGGYWVPGHWG